MPPAAENSEVSEEELRRSSRRGSVTLPVPPPLGAPEPPIWTPASVSAFLSMNAALFCYLYFCVPLLQANNSSTLAVKYGIMCYIGALGVSQLGELLCTGTGTGYGKFQGATSTEKTAYQAFMDKLSAPALPVKISWWTMEQPAFFVPLVFEFLSIQKQGICAGNVYLVLLMIHYAQRSFVFPCLSKGRPFPVLHWFLAFTFCTCNGTMQSLDLLYADRYPTGSLEDALSLRAFFGYALFFFGMATNIHSDSILRNLRKPGDKGYKIPFGGLFQYISGANLWGEVLEWAGFALATGAPTAILFSAFNVVGIGGRAIATHDWYVKKFGDEYFALQRKKFIPFLW